MSVLSRLRSIQSSIRLEEQIKTSLDEPDTEDPQETDIFLKNISKGYFGLDNLLFMYPATAGEISKLINEDSLKQELNFHIQNTYPDLQEPQVDIIKQRGCAGGIHVNSNIDITVLIRWMDGAKNVSMLDIHKRCESYFKNIPPEHLKWRVSYQRLYSEKSILTACRKYADCISKDLPINMNNIKCFKVGGITLINLAIGDLDLMDYI